MRSGSAGFRFVAALILALTCAGAPAGAAGMGEAYYSLDRMKVPFHTGQVYHRLLILDLDLALASIEDKEKIKQMRHAIKTEIEKALGAKSIAELEGGNLAKVVKRVARAAAQRAAGDVKISDALIRNARLL